MNKQNLPPSAGKIENAVLAAMLTEKDALDTALSILHSEDFYEPKHIEIFIAIQELYRAGQPVDLLTTTNKLRSLKKLDAAGGAFYLTGLTQEISSGANAEYHARILQEYGFRRKLISASGKLHHDLFDESIDVFEMLETNYRELNTISEKLQRKAQLGMRGAVKANLDEIEKLKNKQQESTGIPTGWHAVDRIIGGWNPSNLVIVAGRPGMGKCLGKGTKVVMFDGTLKNVEDVRPGDKLMGDDSTPRNVLSICRGREQMYWVRQNRAMDYRVNESHILSLKKSRTEGKGNRGDVLNISVKDYLDQSNKFKTNYKGYKVESEFLPKKTLIPPYLLGLWLGDGTASKPEICNPEPEIKQYIQQYADSVGMRVTTYDEDRCPIYSLAGTDMKHETIRFKHLLNHYKLINNKHIPEDYLLNSSNNRLELLAGLLDTDGHYLEQSNGYEITQKSKVLAEQIKRLCDTLGFRTSINQKTARISSIGYECEVYRVRIYGNTSRIPMRLKRKQSLPWKSSVDWRNTGISLEKDIIDDYYGFEIDGNRLFLLEDNTVTHNTAWALQSAKFAAVDMQKPVVFFSLEMSERELVMRLQSAEAKIDSFRLRTGNITNDELKRLYDASDNLITDTLIIDDTPGLQLFELKAKCNMLKRKVDIGAIFVDYLQLLSTKAQNREQEISTISRGLKNIAKELNIPVIALSQLSRESEKRPNKRPQLSDLRDSGSIEQDADAVIFLYRPEYYGITEDEKNENTQGMAKVLIEKHRHGGIADINLRFHAEYTSFTGWDDIDDFNQDEDDGYGMR